MYFVVAVYEVTTRAPKYFRVLLQRMFLPLRFFILLEVSQSGPFATVRAREIQDLPSAHGDEGVSS